ncbi:MAG: FtsL-like putative cell division protein [Bacteroidota bacterium]
MAQNTFRKPVEKPKEKKKFKFKVKTPKISGANTIGKFLQSIIDGSFLTRDNYVKSIPFLLYVVFIALLYIANTFLAERTIRTIESTKLELKELRAEYLSLKTVIMKGKKQSKVAEILLKSNTNIKEAIAPPKKIVDTKKAVNSETEKE